MMAKHAGPPHPMEGALNNLRRVQLLTGVPLLAFGAIEVLQADHAAIVRAVNNWHALARELDGGPKRLIANINDQLRAAWKAEDERAVEEVLASFQEKTESLRGVFNDVAGCLDEVGSAYRNFIWTVTAFSAALVTAALAAAALTFTPAGPQARVYLRLLAAAADKSLLAWAGVMTSYLGAVSYTLFNLWRRDLYLDNFAPTGSSAVDFKQVRIDVGRYPTFDEFPNDQEMLKGTSGFNWIAPKQDKPTKYGQ
ncbi:MULTISPECIES: hypothetical protein [unclassified Streptosporangium]|uniref:hypothetical protein n=1 Tax=unclassified Streptosporangium TaxID=2632669 RepID=UPI002E2BFD9B|nr:MULTISPECIES: hypothetical protein [unclassified Streptosporangium]